jgi:hypothetical protein
VTQYLRFTEGVADSQYVRGADLKYWVTAMPSGIFFEIWPLEKGRALTMPMRWLLFTNSYGFKGLYFFEVIKDFEVTFVPLSEDLHLTLTLIIIDTF